MNKRTRAIDEDTYKLIIATMKNAEKRGLTYDTEYKYDTTGGYKNSRYADVVVYDSKGRVMEIHQVSYEEAKILDEWAKEYNVPQHHPAEVGSGQHFPG